MARNKRICKVCKRQIKRGEHWRMVESSLWERLIHGAIWGLNHHEPQHWNCQHPTQPSPHDLARLRLEQTPSLPNPGMDEDEIGYDASDAATESEQAEAEFSNV
jgi:hypothetical protein